MQCDRLEDLQRAVGPGQQIPHNPDFTDVQPIMFNGDEGEKINLCPSHKCIQTQLERGGSAPSCDWDGTWACLLRFNSF
jgi:hypothetical protein